MPSTPLELDWSTTWSSGDGDRRNGDRRSRGSRRRAERQGDRRNGDRRHQQRAFALAVRWKRPEEAVTEPPSYGRLERVVAGLRRRWRSVRR